MLSGSASTGARFTAVTLIVKFCVELVPFAVAVTDAGAVPEVPAGGARWMFPVRVVPAWALSVRVMYEGPDRKSVVEGESVDLGGRRIIEKETAATVMFAMARRTTGRSTLFT